MAVLFLMDETVTPEISTLARSLLIEKKFEAMGIERRLYQLNQSVQNVESHLAAAIEEANRRSGNSPSVVFVYGGGKVRVIDMPEDYKQLERLINGIH